MGVDLHFIGSGISSGGSHNGFGKIVSFPSVPAGFPAFGTFNSWLYNVTLPIGNGEYVTPIGTSYPIQSGDVQLKNDGAGGTYTDWSTKTNVQYLANNTYIGTDYNTDVAYVSFSTNCNGEKSEGAGQINQNYYSDGAGSYYAIPFTSWDSADYFLFEESCEPEEGGDEIVTQYYTNGTGGYYTV